MTTYACLRCGDPYEQGRRLASHFCPPCRTARTREATRARVHELRAAKRELVLAMQLGGGLDGDAVDYAELMGDTRRVVTLDDYADVLDDEGRAPVTIERPLTGATSRRGPDHGRSTGWADHRGDWDGIVGWRVKLAADDPWWSAHHHWSYALNDADEARRYNLAA